MSGPDGVTVALSALEPGVLETGTRCRLPFTVDVPAGKGFYGIEVSHRGVVRFREADLAGKVDLSIGD